MAEVFVRFVVGGLVVSIFAILADALKPKSFAGLFGAAPSVALATISLTVLKEGKDYAVIETRSMVSGAVAFLVYACWVCSILMQKKWPALATTAISVSLWLGCALGLWFAVLR